MQIPKLYYLCCSLKFYIIVTGKIHFGKKNGRYEYLNHLLHIGRVKKKRFIWFKFFFFNQSFKNNTIITAVWTRPVSKQFLHGVCFIAIHSKQSTIRVQYRKNVTMFITRCYCYCCRLNADYCSSIFIMMLKPVQILCINNLLLYDNTSIYWIKFYCITAFLSDIRSKNRIMYVTFMV